MYRMENGNVAFKLCDSSIYQPFVNLENKIRFAPKRFSMSHFYESCTSLCIGAPVTIETFSNIIEATARINIILLSIFVIARKRFEK